MINDVVLTVLKARFTLEDLEILDLLSKGLPSKEIALKVHRSDSNVKYRIRKILRNLEARDRAHAISIAFRLKIIE